MSSLRQPSSVAMRGTRSWNSLGTRSSYSSIGSVTCESVEMNVAPRYVSVLDSPTAVMNRKCNKAARC